MYGKETLLKKTPSIKVIQTFYSETMLLLSAPSINTDFFYHTVANVVYTGLSDLKAKDPFGATLFYQTHPEHLAFTAAKIRQFDTGINNIEIKTQKNEYNQELPYPVFYHNTENGKKMPLLYDAESSGTKMLFGTLMNYHSALSTGAVLILDEFDLNLHPDILPHLLDLFLVKEKNPKNAQLIFTSHNTDIMDILGRYRTYIFEKSAIVWMNPSRPTCGTTGLFPYLIKNIWWEDSQKLAEKRQNPRKDRFLQSLPKDEFVCDIAEARGKLSFSLKYFDGSQKAGQDFKDWNDNEKTKLLDKLKEYSKENKQYWLNQRTGSGGLTILEIYGAFPRNSDFSCPIHVPDNVKWARFRLESKVRLIGFFIDETEAQEKQLSTDIFYVVFLDKNHRFYLTEKE